MSYLYCTIYEITKRKLYLRHPSLNSLLIKLSRFAATRNTSEQIGLKTRRRFRVRLKSGPSRFWLFLAAKARQVFAALRLAGYFLAEFQRSIASFKVTYSSIIKVCVLRSFIHLIFYTLVTHIVFLLVLRFLMHVVCHLVSLYYTLLYKCFVYFYLLFSVC